MRRKALLCTSNGAGLGHVTRMMAIGQRLRRMDIDPHIFTLSSALPVPVSLGFRVDHLPSNGYLDIPSAAWHHLLEDRMLRLVDEIRPAVIVFDGVFPYRGLTNALDTLRDSCVKVWSRRGMWRPGVAERNIGLAKHFDEIIEPGEYAESFDRGITACQGEHVNKVAPICFEHETGTLDRNRACADLGLDPTEQNVLVQLGAGAINDLSTTVGSTVARLAALPGHRICLARSALSIDASSDLTPRLVAVERFPISRWFAAFDSAIVAPGYNTFHEVLGAALPAIVVPNLETKTDDQDARSRWADAHGCALRWDGFDEARLDEVIETIADSQIRLSMRRRMERLPRPTGAEEAARLIDSWVRI